MRAKVTFLTTAEGGFKNPPNQSYYAPVLLLNGHGRYPSFNITCDDAPELGREIAAEVTSIQSPGLTGWMAGFKFELLEGGRVVARGEFTR